MTTRERGKDKRVIERVIERVRKRQRVIESNSDFRE